MDYSFSTVLMTVLASNLLIVLISFCFRQKKVLLSVGYRLLAVFLILTAIRCIFPFELPFAKNIYLAEPISRLVYFIRHPYFYIGSIEITIWLILECIWFIGCVVKLIPHIKKHRILNSYIRHYGTDLTKQEPYCSILDDICQNRRRNPFRVISLPGLQAAQIAGIFAPKILLPAYMSPDDPKLYYVLRHETFHHFHHDLLKKELVSLLCICYWWNPAGKLFHKQVNSILEMHVDAALVGSDSNVTVSYLNALVGLAQDAAGHANTLPPGISTNGLTVAAAAPDTTELANRFHMMCHKRQKSDIALFLPLCAMVALIYIGSYCILFEGSYHGIVDQDTSFETLGLDNSFYAVPRDDGTYDLYYNGTLLETIDTLDYYRELPVIPAE